MINSLSERDRLCVLVFRAHLLPHSRIVHTTTPYLHAGPANQAEHDTVESLK